MATRRPVQRTQNTVTPSSDERYKSSTDAPMWSLWKVVHVLVLNFEQLRHDNFLAKILILLAIPKSGQG